MPTPSSAAPAVAASHPKVSSLQQLLTLKNRVLMELQRHGFGTPSATHPDATTHAPAGASGSGFAARPASGGGAAPAPGTSRAAAAANQRFIGVGGNGFSVARNQVPVIAAIAAAVVAALLVLLIALGLGRRRQPKAPAAGTTGGSSSGNGAGAAARTIDAEQTAVPLAKATDDPVEAELLAILARTPSSKRALMGLAAHYAERNNAKGFDEIAQRIYHLSGGSGPNWTHVASIGRQLDPDNPLYALKSGEAGEADEADEAGLSPDANEVAPLAPAAEVAPAAPEQGHPVQSEAAGEHAAEAPPVAPAAATAPAGEALRPEAPFVEPAASSGVPPSATPAAATEPSSEGAPEANAPLAAEHAEAEHAPEPPLDAPDVEATAPQGEPTLPPEAVAALDGLDMGLPPRVSPETGSAVQPGPGQGAGTALEHEATTEREREGKATDAAATTDAAAHHLPAEGATDEVEYDEHGERTDAVAQAAPATPTAPPAVTGLGAAPVGRLNLSFDLDLPNAQAGDGPPDDAAPRQFTAAQLARIARNKLDLAAEYIELGDLGGARTLIHEVIESNDAATHDEAHALLATLAPLS